MSGDSSISVESSQGPGQGPDGTRDPGVAGLPDSGTGADSVLVVDAESPQVSRSQAFHAGAGGADSAARTAQLEAELIALKGQYDNLNGQYMRLAADFDNFRKRQSRDNDDLRLQITCGTLGEILPVLDNFERARQQLSPQHEEAQTLHRSYQGLYKQLVDVFKQLGVAPMRVEGEPFDPNLHEAVLREESEEHPEDVIVAELQRGYHLNGRVLRHALVKVSMGPGPGEGAAASGSTAGEAPEPSTPASPEA